MKKKLLFVSTSLLLALVLTACGSIHNITVVPTATATPIPAANAMPQDDNSTQVLSSEATPQVTATPLPVAAVQSTPIPVIANTPLPVAVSTPVPTPAPTPTPVQGPVITKHPTGETVTEGGTVIFVARADNYDSMSWQLISPDGTTLSANNIASYFPTMTPDGLWSETLYLRNAPAALSGWRAQAVFTKNGISAASSFANITISPFFTQIPHYYVFSSGAGAWSTELTLNNDGTFTGLFHDWDATNSYDGNPNHSQTYTCTFSGRFSNPRKLDGYSYAITLDYLSYSKSDAYFSEVDQMWYVPSDPYGLTDGTNFTVYLPGIPASSLPTDFAMWAHMGDSASFNGYAIYNVANGDTFVSYN